VDYTLPPGYSEVIGMRFFDSTMVAIAPAADGVPYEKE